MKKLYYSIQELVLEWYLVRTDGLSLWVEVGMLLQMPVNFSRRSEAKDHKNVKSIDNHLLNTFWSPSTVLKTYYSIL